jgi:hypothetical protein
MAIPVFMVALIMVAVEDLEGRFIFLSEERLSERALSPQMEALEPREAMHLEVMELVVAVVAVVELLSIIPV